MNTNQSFCHVSKAFGAFFVSLFWSFGFIVSAQCTDPEACNYDAEAGGFCVTTEVVQVHESGILEGMTTYRVYLEANSPLDFVTAIFGDQDYPLVVSTTTSFYQHPLGAPTPNWNTVLYPIYPELQYDSFVTIGIDSAPIPTDGESAVQTVASSAQNWIVDFDPGGGVSGGDLIINDAIGGSWFVLAGESNGFAGDDGRVLLAQLTTDGDISGQLNLQIFPEGVQGDMVLETHALGQVCSEEDCQYLNTVYVDLDGDGFGTDEAVMCGVPDGYAAVGGDCNDNSAISFPGNPYDIPGDGIDGDCDGGESCYRDVDNDGYRSEDELDLIGSPFNVNCSEFGEAYFSQPLDCDDTNPELTEADLNGNCILPDDVVGCGQPGACNYDPDAGPEEDNCEFISCVGCGNPSACNYDPFAIITDDEECDFVSCAGCTDEEATNYNPDVLIANDDNCLYSGILAIAPILIDFEGAEGEQSTYTNEVYALLPPNAIQLNSVIGVKSGDVRLRITAFDTLLQSEACDQWTPDGAVPLAVDVAGVSYTNMECIWDSWLTIGGSLGNGPELVPIGFDPQTVEDQEIFDSEALEMEGDTLGWSLANSDDGLTQNHCAELFNRPGCANAVRIARLTLPLGVSFTMQAGLTYTVNSSAERSVDGSTETTSSETASDSGGGGEADSDDALIVDNGTTVTVYGCLNATACNFDPSANADSGDCDFEGCSGCSYPSASNFGEDNTVDDGSCLFEGCTDPDYLEFDGTANVDNGACLTLIQLGCTDSGFLEFSEDANVLDLGSCLTPVVPGCTYADAYNYDGEANKEDGSCQYGGCTDPEYLEFDVDADVDNGGCETPVLVGCTDDGYLEFDASYNTFGDGTCNTAVLEGCTYMDANNFEPISNRDNGSCTFSIASDCVADFDGTGDVGTTDLLTFLTFFNSVCD